MRQQARQHGPARDPECDRGRPAYEGIAGGVDQDQRARPVAVREHEVPGDVPTQRVAGDDEARDTQARGDVIDEAHVGADAVVARGAGPGQAERRQVEANHAVSAGELGGPAVPGVQRRRGAVHEHDRRTDPLVAVVHLQPVHLDEARRAGRPARAHGLERQIATPLRGHAHRQQDRHQHRRSQRPAPPASRRSRPRGRRCVRRRCHGPILPSPPGPDKGGGEAGRPLSLARRAPLRSRPARNGCRAPGSGPRSIR